MTLPPTPKNLTDLLADLIANGWSFRVDHAKDSGQDPFIRVLAARRDGSERVEATWHSRDTGGQRYRWRSAFHAGDPVPTLTKLRNIITKEGTE